MSEVLHSHRVLVLNRNWQAISITSPAQAFCQLMSGGARALDIRNSGEMLPLDWDDWMTTEIRQTDQCVGTARGRIRVPTVIILNQFSKVPVCRPKFSARAVRQRDGNQCQYTGRILRPGEGNIDHVIPRSRGGETSWTNCVWACKRVNTHKGNKTPEEARLRLRKRPEPPKAVPMTWALPNPLRINDWDFFLPRHKDDLMGQLQATWD